MRILFKNLVRPQLLIPSNLMRRGKHQPDRVSHGGVRRLSTDDRRSVRHPFLFCSSASNVEGSPEYLCAQDAKSGYRLTNG